MKYRNANIWIMSLLYIMSGVFWKQNKMNFLICKETNAHTKSNARGSFETN